MLEDRTTPKRANGVGGWTANGKILVSPAGTIRPNSEVVLQTGLDEAYVYTAQFFKVEPPIAAGATSRARATIIWSVEGGSASRIIDVSNGVSISGVGRHVNIKIADNLSTQLAAVSNNYDVSVQVSKGARATSGSPPTLFLGNQVVGPAATIAFPIPPGSGANSVWIGVRPLTAIPYGSNELAVAIASGAAFLGGFNFEGCNQWAPLIAGASEIDVTNFSAGNSYSVSCTLGIEG